jgi:hypothetical protein
VARLQQAGRDRLAHAAETDESDLHGETLGVARCGRGLQA